MRSLLPFFLMITGLTAAGHAFAAGAPAAPAGTGGGARAGAVGAASYNPGSGMNNLSGTYQPSTFSVNGGSYMDNTGYPVGNGMAYGYAPPMNTVGAYLQQCFNGLSNGLTAYSESKQMQAMMDDENDKEGFQDYPGISSGGGRRLYNSLNSHMTDAEKGCQKFISKDGKIGPWGRSMLTEMEKFKDIYESDSARDVTRFCPNFDSLSPEDKKLYWIWFFTSVSSPESACNSGAAGRGPNGTAIGLFQLEANACNRAGVGVSSQDLWDPYNNIRCAVAVFAKEVRCRGTIIATTSKGECGTYWGTLRGGSASSVDRPAARKAEALMGQYQQCHK